MTDFDGPIADSMEALASRLRKASRVLLDEIADLKAENARLTEALDLLRPVHNTPYEDEGHQGSNCVDIAMRYCLAWHKTAVTEGALRKVREWCDRSEADEDWLGAVAEVRALLPAVAS